MARTWERAWSRVRLGHVIRYIGRGRAATRRASQTSSTVQGADLTVGQLPAPDGLLHSGKVNMYRQHATW